MHEESVIYISLECVIALLAITSNALVCYVVVNSRGLRKKVMYMFVTSLAVADILVGAFAIPFSVLTKVGLPHSAPALCVAMLSLIMVPTQISIFNMTAVAIERYLAIRYPRVHYTKLTRPRCLAVIICTWVVSAVIGLLPLFGWNTAANGASSKNQMYSTFGTNATADSSIGNIQGNSTSDTVVCKFMEVMDFDYMFFNFVVCVIPPLFISAILYSVVFFAFLRATKKNSSRELTTAAASERHSALTPTQNSSPLWKSKEALNNVEEKLPNNINEKNNRKNQLCSKEQCGDIKVVVQSPSSSTLPCHANPRNGSVTSGLIENKKSDGSLDSHLLTARLEILEKQRSTKPTFSLKTVAENGYVLSSGFNSTVSSASQSPVMRSRCGTDCSERTKYRHHEHRQRKRRREVKAAAVLFLIVLCFAICWMPIHCLNTIYRFKPELAARVPSAVYSIAILLSHANSAINFFLYSWRLKAFRRQLNKLILKR